MSRSSSAHRVAVVGVFWCVSLAHTAAAQRPASSPHAPDILGISVGMPAAEAKAQLQKHSSDVYVKDAMKPAEGFGLTLNDEPRDEISVFTTLPPSAPAVWRVERNETYSNQKLLPLSTLLAALHQKYGKETLSRARDAGRMELYWIYDADGRLRSQADPGLMECSHQPLDGSGGPMLYPQCLKEFYGVYVLTNGTADGVQWYNMVLVSDPFEIQAMKATQAKQADDAQHQPKAPTADAPKF